jgi:hypothetical protein
MFKVTYTHYGRAITRVFTNETSADIETPVSWKPARRKVYILQYVGKWHANVTNTYFTRAGLDAGIAVAKSYGRPYKVYSMDWTLDETLSSSN